MSQTQSHGHDLKLAALAAAVGLVACTPYQVHTDYDREASFGELHSFAWMDSSRRGEDESANPFLERRVKRAVELVMKERGLAAGDAGSADLLVTAFVIAPTHGDGRMPRWSSMSCGPSVSIWFGRRYPYGFTRRGLPWTFFSPYWRDPWGYACAYQIGFGYAWLPLYERPGAQLPGTLVIDMFDRKSRELVWRGSAEGALLDARRSDQRQEEIDAIVREILRRFPPA